MPVHHGKKMENQDGEPELKIKPGTSITKESEYVNRIGIEIERYMLNILTSQMVKSFSSHEAS